MIAHAEKIPFATLRHQRELGVVDVAQALVHAPRIPGGLRY
jgi:hypothetical protein